MHICILKIEISESIFDEVIKKCSWMMLKSFEKFHNYKQIE